MEKNNVPKNGMSSPELTLTEVAEKLGKDPVDVLLEMRNGSGAILKQLEDKSPKWVDERFGGSTKDMQSAFQKLEKVNGDKLKLLNAQKDFAAEVKSEGWGSWALRKVKETVMYPIKHPIKTLGYALLAAAVIGGGLYLSGNLQTAMTGPVAESIKSWFHMSGPSPMGPMDGLSTVPGSPIG